MTQGFYEQLGADPGASPRDLREAYRVVVARLQRRRKALLEQGGDTSLLDLTRHRLDEAWQVLSDPVRRRRYDAMLVVTREERPTGGDALWGRVAGALVHPAAAAATDLLRSTTTLGIGVIPVAPRPAGRPRFDEDPPTVPTAVPVGEEAEASVVPLPTARATPDQPLRVVEGSRTGAPVIMMPQASERFGPRDVEALVGTHGYTGALLRAVREARGLSLQEMSDSSRISERYLEAVESDDYERLPSATFVRGYVREMARLLSLDEQAVVAGYMRRFSGES